MGQRALRPLSDGDAWMLLCRNVPEAVCETLWAQYETERSRGLPPKDALREPLERRRQWERRAA
jgi:hypothetical protein